MRITKKMMQEMHERDMTYMRESIDRTAQKNDRLGKENRLLTENCKAMLQSITKLKDALRHAGETIKVTAESLPVT